MARDLTRSGHGATALRRAPCRSVVIGLVLGLTSSAWLALAVQDDQLESALPGVWVTASLGLAVLGVGWLLSAISPRFAAALAAGAIPGAVYGAIALAGEGSQQLAYAWSAVPVALGWVAVVAAFSGPRGRSRPWSARRRTAPRVPRARTH